MAILSNFLNRISKTTLIVGRGGMTTNRLLTDYFWWQKKLQKPSESCLSAVYKYTENRLINSEETENRLLNDQNCQKATFLKMKHKHYF